MLKDDAVYLNIFSIIQKSCPHTGKTALVSTHGAMSILERAGISATA